ncbi:MULTISPECIES: response regulator [Salinibaculum]|uniref:response regulator n=1 Tax=Salinibaculum TaxID=2732368 RepID=UPI0030D33101
MTTETVEIPRSILGTSARAGQREAPLVRSEELESLDESVLEVPTPLIDVAESQPIRVLHVDDNPDITEVTSVFLERINDRFDVMTETTVVEALETLRRSEVDCIISDYQMPNTDGLEFLEIVRDRHPDLPFILYTGKGSEEIASEAIATGVTDYMQKRGGSDQYEVLSNRIENAVEQYRTQQQFWDALSWYQRLVEQNIAGVFVIQDRELAYVNQKLADIFGYDQGDLIGEPPVVLASPGERDRVERALKHCRRTPSETFEDEFTGKRRSGEDITVEVHGGPVEYNDEQAILCILRDVSGQS